MDKTELGKKIQALRKARGFSRQDDLRAKPGISVHVVKELEGGKGNTTLNNLALVLGVLKVRFVDIFAGLEPLSSENRESDQSKDELFGKIVARLAALNEDELGEISDMLDDALGPADSASSHSS